MHQCCPWELWRVHNQITDVLMVANLEPMEGLPVFNHQIDWRISVYFRREDLAEFVGTVEESEMALITREYLRVRQWGSHFVPLCALTDAKPGN